MRAQKVFELRLEHPVERDSVGVRAQAGVGCAKKSRKKSLWTRPKQWKVYRENLSTVFFSTNGLTQTHWTRAIQRDESVVIASCKPSTCCDSRAGGFDGSYHRENISFTASARVQWTVSVVLINRFWRALAFSATPRTISPLQSLKVIYASAESCKVFGGRMNSLKFFSASAVFFVNKFQQRERMEAGERVRASGVGVEREAILIRLV